ncbi:MAG: ADP-ribose pyrophosphatase [Candidatus Saccharibacteria bacterium]|jgi:mutator protein MutT|nr:ADP-ribose pyrophosphatase [Candidatus Saccharibacteria bacterium]
MSHPRVGVGIIIPDDAGRILIMQRTGTHAPKFSIPGGKLDLGETFEQAAIREVREELDISVINPRVIAVTNNLETHAEEGVHFISVILLAEAFEGEPKIMEPHKCLGIDWHHPHSLPEPHFDASRLGVQCWLQNRVYVG